MNGTNSTPKRVLIADDEQDIRRTLTQLLKQKGIEPLEAANGKDALSVMRRERLDLVLLDVRMSGLGGMQVLRKARQFDTVTPVIMITGFGSIRAAIRAVKEGAHDYLTKPLDHERLILTIERALENGHIRREYKRLCSRLDVELPLHEAMGYSDPIRRIIAEVERVAPTDYTVILTGETGSGKELVARAIHRRSHRASGRFVPVDCGAIPTTLIENELFGHEKGSFTGADRALPGKFELASNGTLLLDEASNLPLSVQAKLLRALQERQIWRIGGIEFIDVDVRVLLAANQDLPSMVAEGHFRADLYHRLNEFTIRVPPLRERQEDIIFLAKRFFDLANAELGKDLRGISGEALEALLAYKWPGNVRELRNVIRRGVLLADTYVRPEHLHIHTGNLQHAGPQPDDHGEEPDENLSLKEIVHRKVSAAERHTLTKVLRQTGGNKAKAARILQIDYKTIQKKVKEYGIFASGVSGGGADG